MGVSPFVVLLIDFAVALNLDFQVFRQSVDNRNSHAVKAAGDFVGSFIEFPSGVQLREHNFRSGYFLGRMNVDGNATTVVNHRNAIIDVDCHVDLVAVTGQGLVDRVVDNLVDEMM